MRHYTSLGEGDTVKERTVIITDRGPVQYSLGIWLTCIGFSLAGCASPSPPSYVALPLPPAEEVRTELGPLAVVKAATPTATEFTQPMGKGRAAGHGGWVGFWTPPSVLASGGDGRGVVLGLFLSPVAGTAGAIYGAVAGMSQAEYDRIRSILCTTVQAVDWSSRLEIAVTDSIRQLTAQSIADTPATAQTTLELTPLLIRLTGTFDIEPPLTLNASVRVRLLRTVDQTELFVSEFSYTGAEHSLREWAAANGTPLQKEMDAAWRSLSALIVEQIFLTYSLPESPAQQRVLPWPLKK